MREVPPRTEAAAKAELVEDRPAVDPVVTFLYLRGAYMGGPWNFGNVALVNGPLLWQDALDYFKSKMR
jgi:hypothetical protein